MRDPAYHHEFGKGIAARQQLDVIIFDFSKAFNKVSHQRLLYKLHHYEVQNNTLAWFEGFLHGRNQQVFVDCLKSSMPAIDSGVTQRTILEPLLFLAFINDLPDVIQSSARHYMLMTVCYLPRYTGRKAPSYFRMISWHKSNGSVTSR